MRNLIFAVGLLLACPAAAQVPDTEQLVRRLMQVWASGDTSALAEITTLDVVYDDVPNRYRFEGREGVKRYVTHVHAWAAELTIEVKRVHAGQQVAVAEWVLRAVQARPIPGRVPVATGQRFELAGLTLIELREGRIARAADYLDVLGFVLALGARVELPGGVVLPATAAPPGPAKPGEPSASP